MENASKMLVRRVYDEIINREDATVIDELFAPTVVVHDPFMGTQQGIDAFKQLLGMFDTAFPHHRVEVRQVIADGDYASVLHTHLARHSGPFMGLPPTGKEIRVDGVEVFRIENGKVVEFWRHDDDAGLLRQLGLLPDSNAVSERALAG